MRSADDGMRSRAALKRRDPSPALVVCIKALCLNSVVLSCAAVMSSSVLGLRNILIPKQNIAALVILQAMEIAIQPPEAHKDVQYHHPISPN